ncbi:MAG: hypothetical protein ACPGR2_10830 [Psychrobium sp.]
MPYQYALGVTSRTIAAIFGGYLFSVICSFAFVPLLTGLAAMPLPDAVYLSTMLSYFAYIFILIWVFCKKSAWLAWRDLVAFSVCLIAFYFAFEPSAGALS